MAAIIFSICSVLISVVGWILCIGHIDNMADTWDQSYNELNKRLDEEVKASKERDRNLRAVAAKMIQSIKPKKNEKNSKSN